jgi:hypothetical protein
MIDSPLFPALQNAPDKAGHGGAASQCQMGSKVVLFITGKLPLGV